MPYYYVISVSLFCSVVHSIAMIRNSPYSNNCVLVCSFVLQMLEAEAIVRERERQALELENKRSEMEWTAELVSVRGRMQVLEQDVVKNNEIIRQLKISSAHKDAEIASLKGFNSIYKNIL